MTSREKKLAVVLGVMGVFGVGMAAFTLGISPWLDSREAANKLEAEFNEKDQKLRDLETRTRKLDVLKARSLPADADEARHEYGALLSEILGASKLPRGSYTLTPHEPADASKVPVVGPKQPAYFRIGYTIVLRKVDLPGVIRFLQNYYQHPTLQQITNFTIKKASAEEASGRKADARSDLEVTIITEAVSIDGIDKTRKTLMPVSVAYGGLGGNLGMVLLQNETGPARHFTPANITSELAKTNRDYAVMAAKDPFHGPLPPPIVIKKEETKKPIITEEVKAPPVPKEDISPYIRLTGITWRNDGTATAEIHDSANRYDYLVERKSNLTGDMVTRVKKYYYLNNAAKVLESFDDLIISEDGTATDRQFKVLQFAPEGLLLQEVPLPVKEEKTAEVTIDDVLDEEKPKEDPKAKTDSKTKGSTGKSNTGKSSTGKGSTGKTGGNTSKKTTVEIKKGPQPLGALVGGAVFAPNPPPIRIYLWHVGEPMSKLDLQTAPAAVKPTPPAPMVEPKVEPKVMTPVDPPKAAPAAPSAREQLPPPRDAGR